MARNPTGRWVARVGATGGGRTYRGQVPVNWYAALVLIVLLGLASIIYSRHEYQSPAAATTPPVVGTTWYAGYDFYVCGKALPSLPSNQSATSSNQAFYTTGNGVITISPKTASQAGANATLGKFVDGYPKLVLTNDRIAYPGPKGVTTYTNGQTCPKGTPDAGKKAAVAVTSWANFLNSTKGVAVKGTVTDLRFSSNQEITIGFVPAGTKLPRPPGQVELAMLNAAGASSTTTTAPGATTTTAPSATTTTAPRASSTTTAAKPPKK
jgi:hypothetical protein